MNVWDNASDPKLIKSIIDKVKNYPAQWEKITRDIPSETLSFICNHFYNIVPSYVPGTFSILESNFLSYRAQIVLEDTVNLLIYDTHIVKLCSLPEEALKMIIEIEEKEQKVRAVVAYIVVRFLKGETK